jgi:Cupin domain
MADVSVLRPADGELIQLGPTRLRILEDGRTTEHRLGIGEITPRRMPMARPSSAMPRTTRASSFRAARFTVGQTSCEAPAGAFVMIPPGAPHTFANPTDQPTMLLNTFTPDLYVQYFRDLRDTIAAVQSLTPEATVQLMLRHSTVPATDFA